MLYDFIIRAFIGGGLIAIIAPFIGCFVVTRRYALISDTLAHSALLGVALSALLASSPILTTLLATIITGIAIEFVRQRKSFYPEAILSLFLWGNFSLALLIIALSKGVSSNLIQVLFGSISLISIDDLIVMLVLTVITFILLSLFYKELYSVSFDEELAKAGGVRVAIINIIFMVLTAVTVSLAMRVAGVLLIGALMVIPVLSAMQIARSFRGLVFSSILISVISMYGGLLFSLNIDVPLGASIVLFSIFVFIILGLFKRTEF